jgi:hypothetical protein
MFSMSALTLVLQQVSQAHVDASLASNGSWLLDAFDALNAIFTVRLIPFFVKSVID